MTIAEQEIAGPVWHYKLDDVCPIKLGQAQQVREDDFYDQFRDVLMSGVWGRPGSPLIPQDVLDADIEIMYLTLTNPSDGQAVSVWIDSWWPFTLAITQNFSAQELASKGEMMFGDSTFPNFTIYIVLKSGVSVVFDGTIYQSMSLMVMMAPKDTVLRIADYLVGSVDAHKHDDGIAEYVPHIIAECYGDDHNTFGFFSHVDMLRIYIQRCLHIDNLNRFVVQVSRGEDPVIIELDNSNVEEKMTEIVNVLS